MGVIIFNGHASTEAGIEVMTPPGYTFPERDYEVTHVPGRNGDIILDKGSYKNIEKSYNVNIFSKNEPYPVIARKLVNWLHSGSGYCRLEDSYDPDFYMLGMYMENGSLNNILQVGVRTTVKFNCKPQRFYKTGDNPVTFTESGSLINPSIYEALPIIKVFGSGNITFTINGYSVNLANVTSVTDSNPIIVNSEIQDVYQGTTNKNSIATFAYGFPKLGAGVNTITLGSGVTKLIITPKWWTL